MQAVRFVFAAEDARDILAFGFGGAELSRVGDVAFFAAPFGGLRIVVEFAPIESKGNRFFRDSGGEIDVAVIELEREKLPPSAVLHAFTAENLTQSFTDVDVGESLLVVGFPLGFHDVRHHLPVVRHAVIASPYGVRFQGQGYFLTDARTHRGISGAPVVMRDPAAAAQGAALPWKLLGIHSSSLDVGDRDRLLDHSLGLNCVWYANILLILTQVNTEAAPEPEPAAGLRRVT